MRKSGPLPPWPPPGWSSGKVVCRCLQGVLENFIFCYQAHLDSNCGRQKNVHRKRMPGTLKTTTFCFLLRRKIFFKNIFVSTWSTEPFLRRAVILQSFLAKNRINRVFIRYPRGWTRSTRLEQGYDPPICPDFSRWWVMVHERIVSISESVIPFGQSLIPLHSQESELSKKCRPRT